MQIHFDPTKKYIDRLDGLRGTAVILVMLSHTPDVSDVKYIDAFLTVLKQSPADAIGVDVFFILSGYLITSILKNEIHENQNVLSSFYIKRIFRIFPVIAVTIIGCVVLFPKYNYWYQLFFLSNYYFSFNPDPHPLRHFWSLAVEEQFYIFWPIVLYFFRHSFSRLAPLFIILALASVSAVLIYDFIVATPTSRALIHKGIETRMISLLIGSAIAIYGLRVLPARLLLFAAITSLALMALAKFAGRDFDFAHKAPVFAFGILTCSFCLFTFCLQGGKVARSIFEFSALRYCGKISYGLYVYHLPIFYYFGVSHMYPDQAHASLLEVLMIYSVVLVVAMISWYFFERPLLKYRGLFLPQAHTKK